MVTVDRYAFIFSRGLRDPSLSWCFRSNSGLRHPPVIVCAGNRSTWSKTGPRTFPRRASKLHAQRSYHQSRNWTWDLLVENVLLSLDLYGGSCCKNSQACACNQSKTWFFRPHTHVFAILHSLTAHISFCVKRLQRNVNRNEPGEMFGVAFELKNSRHTMQSASWTCACEAFLCPLLLIFWIRYRNWCLLSAQVVTKTRLTQILMWTAWDHTFHRLCCVYVKWEQSSLTSFI